MLYGTWLRGLANAGLKSFGIGLTRLRTLAKRIGRDRELAQALWPTDVYDARVIAQAGSDVTPGADEHRQ